MDEDSQVPPLSRRVPGAYGRVAPAAPLVLPEDLLRRMRTAVDTERKRAAAQQGTVAGGEPVTDRHEAEAVGQQQAAGQEPVNGQKSVTGGKQATRRRSTGRHGQANGHSRGQDPAGQRERESEPDDVTQPIAICAAETVDIASPPAGKKNAPQTPDRTITLSTELSAPEAAAATPAPAQQQRPGNENGAAKAAESATAPKGGAPAAALKGGAPAAAPKTRAPAAAPKAAAPPRAVPKAGAERRPAGRRYRLAGIAASVLALVAAGSLAFVLLRPAQPASGPARSPGSTALAAAISSQAATWVASQVNPAAGISCDRAMCATLILHGVSSTHLVELNSARTSPLDSGVILATAAVRTLLGRRLSAVYAPDILARFGSGRLQIDVRVIAKNGAAVYQSRLRADVTARKAAAATLLGSSRITLSATARDQLSAGQVDSRLLEVIGTLAALHPDYIVAFTDSGPGAGPDMPLRSVELTQARGTRTMSPAFLRSMRVSLHTQIAELRPAHVRPLVLPDGQAVLSIEFDAPSPLNVFGPPSP